MFAAIFNLYFAACSAGSSFFGFPTWYEYLPENTNVPAGTKCTPAIDLSDPAQVASIVLALIEIMLRISALVAVGFIIYGGFRYILSQGNSDSATAARKTIINAVVGLVIAMVATFVVSFVARTLS